jgi:hypothetical protein
MECGRTSCRDVLFQDTGWGYGWWREDGENEIKDSVIRIKR